MVYGNEICNITQSLKSTQINYKLPHLMRRQRRYEAIKLPIHLQRASDLTTGTTAALNLLNQFMMILHGCCQV